jgi:hypothetical protein
MSKFTAVMFIGTEDLAYINYKFPCPGRLKNISVQVIYGDAQDTEWGVFFGDYKIETLRTTTPIADGSHIVHAFKKHGVHFQGIDFDNLDTSYANHFYHAKGKFLNIRPDKIYRMGVYGKSTNNMRIILNAQFEPFDNGFFSQSWSFDGVYDLTNFDSMQLLIPERLRDAYLEYDLYLKVASETSVIMHPLIAPRGQKMRVTGFISGYGTHDDMILGGDTMNIGSSSNITISSAGAGLAHSQGAVPFRNIINQGELLTFDVTEVEGTISGGELKGIVTLKGKTYRPMFKVFKTLFYDGNQFQLPLEEASN